MGDKEIKEAPVGDAAIFDDLRHAAGKVPVRQRGQDLRVHQHQAWLPEGAGQVFPGLEIDGHLAAHGGVHLGQQGGGELDIADAPENGGGGKARQISYHAAAQGGHGVGAGQAEGHQGLPQLRQLMGIFGVLSGGDGEAEGLEAGLLQT